MFKLSQVQSVEAPLSWLLGLLDMPHHFILNTSLLSGIIRYFRLILTFPAPVLGSSIFSPRSRFLLVRNGVREQNAGCVHFYWCVFVLRLFQKTNTDIHTHQHTHILSMQIYTCTHTHAYIHACAYFRGHGSTLMPPLPTRSLVHTCIFLLQYHQQLCSFAQSYNRSK